MTRAESDDLVNDQNHFSISTTNSEAFSPKAGAEEFERIEDKFLVPIVFRDELIEILNRKSRPCYLTDDTQFLTIESVYYESPEFQSFRDHFQSKPYRFKLRTRRYAANGKEPSDETHLELKSKEGEISRKFRFRLLPQDLGRLNERKPLRASAKMIATNDTIGAEELTRRVRVISRLVEGYRLSPALRVVYNRQAYERKGVRVTIDTNIRSELLRNASRTDLFEADLAIYESAMAMVKKFDPAKFALLEVKHQGITPRWLNAFLAEKGLVKTSFSKYCYSMTTQVSEPASRGAVMSAENG